MSDLISRQALQKAMYERAFETDGDTMWQSGCWVRYRAIEDVIKSQPSADNDSLYEELNEAHNECYDVGYWAGRRDYEQKWIPCEERMPKVGQTVICQCRAGILELLKLDSGGDWYQDAEHAYMSRFVIAWMPLPEPWKGEGE